MQVFIANKRQAIEKYNRLRVHSATLKQFYVSPHRRPPQSVTHETNKRKKKRESRLPFSRRPSAGRWRLSCLVSTVCSAGTSSRSVALPSTSDPQHVRSHVLLSPLFRSSLSRTLTCSSSQVPTQNSSHSAPRPLLDVFHLSTNREWTRHPSPCLSSLRRQGDESDP